MKKGFQHKRAKKIVFCLSLLALSGFQQGCKKNIIQGVKEGTVSVAPALAFVTRSGDKLMDGPNELRFVSFNTPSILINEHAWPQTDDTAETIAATDMEREDVMKSIAQAGLKVIRVLGICTQGEFPGPTGDWTNRRKHVSWDKSNNLVFDEQLFSDMDKALELAHRYGIRLIITLITDYDKDAEIQEWGGVAALGRAHGRKDDALFSTNPADHAAKDDYKAIISYILNRQNKLTGLKYKDDPYILAWETGNELHNDTPEWEAEIANHIKSIDPHHLVMDGHYGIQSGSLDASSPIDIVSDHFYTDTHALGILYDIDIDNNLAKGKKPFIAGEFGTNAGGDVAVMRAFLHRVVVGGTNGALLWALRGHTRKGGFYSHCDGSFVQSCAFHWPGFPNPSINPPVYHDPEEMEMISAVLDASSAVSKTPRADLRLGVPDPPQVPLAKDIAPIEIGGNAAVDSSGRWVGSCFTLRWIGSAGANSYIVERAPASAPGICSPVGGSWTLLTQNASDDQPSPPIGTPWYPFFLYPDCGLTVDATYCYRVKAQYIRSDGSRDISLPSAVITSPPASCMGPWPDTDINACGDGGMDLPYSNNPFTCGKTVADPCGTLHTCSPCPPPPPTCGADTACSDGSCPNDHEGGLCPPISCPRRTPHRCPDGTCVKNSLFCTDPLKRNKKISVRHRN